MGIVLGFRIGYRLMVRVRVRYHPSPAKKRDKSKTSVQWFSPEASSPHKFVKVPNELYLIPVYDTGYST